MENAPNRVESRFILWKALDYLEKIFCVLPVAVMTIIVFVAVLCRYLLKSPLGWSEEVTLICMMWCVFGAAPYAFYRGINVGVTFLVDKIPGKTRHAAEILIYIGTIVFLAVLLYNSGFIAMHSLGKFTKAAHIPLLVPYSAIPYGCVMSILRLVELVFEEAKKMKSVA